MISDDSLDDNKDDGKQRYHEVVDSIKAFKDSRKAREEELRSMGDMRNALKTMGYDSARDHIAAMVGFRH